MRLLFVEDEPDLREVLKKQLQGSGYSVDACGDGLEALDYLPVSYTHLTLPTKLEV